MSEMNVPITTMNVSSMVMLPARYMSCASSARNNSGPVVSSPSTMAVMVSPETIPASAQPTVLTSGLIARRTGYLYSRVFSWTPLARAVITYCRASSSSSEPRITRTR